MKKKIIKVIFIQCTEEKKIIILFFYLGKKLSQIQLLVINQ